MTKIHLHLSEAELSFLRKWKRDHPNDPLPSGGRKAFAAWKAERGIGGAKPPKRRGASLFVADNVPTADEEDSEQLAKMTYREALETAADDQGFLRKKQLIKIARARGYGQNWVDANSGKTLQQVWDGVLAWSERQRR